ncbi:MAG: SIMPL domain-containing protein [archaeon]
MIKKLNATPIIVSTIIVLGILTGIWLLSSMFGGSLTGETIQSVGDAEMTVMPDEAVVYLNVETKADSADQAKNENTKIMDAVLKNLDTIGIGKGDIETQNFNIYEDFDWKEGERTSKGFVASNNIKVSTENFEIIGKIIDAGADEGALISSINFELSNKQENEYKAMVLAQASQDAKMKAESITSGLGKELGDLVSVSSSDFGWTPYPIYRGIGLAVMEDVAEAKVATTNIEPQTLDITATVTVVYEIK